MLIAPIIIPNLTEPNKPDNKCPKCGHEWDDEDDMSFSSIIVGLLISVIIIWLVVTVLYWLGGFDVCESESFYGIRHNCHDGSLLEILKLQWDWIANIPKWFATKKIF